MSEQNLPSGEQEFASAEDILKNAHPTGFPPQRVPDVLIAGKPVFVKVMSAGQVKDFWAFVHGHPEDLMNAATVCYAVVNPNTKERLFTDAQVQAVANTLAQAIQPVFNYFMDMNALTRIPKG